MRRLAFALLVALVHGQSATKFGCVYWCQQWSSKASTRGYVEYLCPAGKDCCTDASVCVNMVTDVYMSEICPTGPAEENDSVWAAASYWVGYTESSAAAAAANYPRNQQLETTGAPFNSNCTGTLSSHKMGNYHTYPSMAS